MTGRNDTKGARDYAINPGHQTDDVTANWWQLFSNYRTNRWRAELRKLSQESGISFEEVCEYLNLSYNRDIGFLSKLPKRRSMYIGIGMAFGQSVDTINLWLMKYCMRQKLYPKDVSEDLIWIYLIQASEQSRKAGETISSGINYFRLFDECAAKVYTVYCQLWNEFVDHAAGTDQTSSDLSKLAFDPAFDGLGSFVAEHMNAFKTAYVKPRVMLRSYVDMILENMEPDRKVQDRKPVNTLRGYLDDSMINYLSGATETINVIDRKSGQRTMNIKHIPKSRKIHIALGLALGMTVSELDEYLQLMGFSQLDATSRDEGILMNLLTQWEQDHGLVQKLKKRVIGQDESVIISNEERKQAVVEILHLRQDLFNMYARQGLEFPHMNS